MQIIKCPKCGKFIRIYCKDGYCVCLDIKKSNENKICPNCKRKISYSIQKSE